MRLDVLTLFPDWFDWFRSQRHVANALRIVLKAAAVKAQCRVFVDIVD